MIIARKHANALSTIAVVVALGSWAAGSWVATGVAVALGICAVTAARISR